MHCHSRDSKMLYKLKKKKKQLFKYYRYQKKKPCSFYLTLIEIYKRALWLKGLFFLINLETYFSFCLYYTCLLFFIHIKLDIWGLALTRLPFLGDQQFLAIGNMPIKEVSWFCFVCLFYFGTLSSGTQGLLLPTSEFRDHSGRLGGPYKVLWIEPALAAGKVSSLCCITSLAH